MTGDVELSGSTSGRILAAALAAMALGATLAARDPWGNRIMINVLIAFTALASLAIAYRLLHHHIPLGTGRTSLVLVLTISATALLAIFYPSPPPIRLHVSPHQEEDQA